MQVSVRPTLVALTILLLAGSVAQMGAQGLAPESARTAPPASKRITVDVVVDEKKASSPAAGLQEQDFTVLDNGAPRKLTSFRALSSKQEPVRVVLVIDALNIRYQGFSSARQQAGMFLRANGGHLANPTAIAFLNDKDIQLRGELSTDGNMLADAAEKQDIGLRTIRGDTGVYGAQERFEISINGLRNLVAYEGKQPGRTSILWVSPGWPLLSGPGFDLSQKDQARIFRDIVNLSTNMRESRVTLYAINPIGSNESLGQQLYYQQFLKGIAKPSQVDLGDVSLQVLAVQSGGVAMNSNDVSGMLQKSVADLESYYEISFEAPPAETPNTYHHLEVRLEGKPGMTARTRDGYYAQP